ncbi:MAG: NADH:flavin oxidoreductase [Deltaproteobacteria bacterium]|jgi:2,4-dienoyl-CoA reductase-like NADH-dependent reductase (Old Yellow Enzyme family)|nr:NADH:flavin oxidoreductase [Deltaproteobacteria bacterium]
MKDIFDKTQLGPLTLKNRIFRASVGDKCISGKIEEDNLNLYKELAKGGVGTILTGFTTVESSDREIVPIFALDEDSLIPQHKELTDAVHAMGALIFSQLVYIGSYTYPALHKNDKLDLVAPSAVKRIDFDCCPRAATEKEIIEVIEKHAQAALRAKKAGYDGIEIHGAHGFFLCQFMTPYYNRREDDWGGSSEKRGRLALEIYKAIRLKVGPDFPVLIKVNVREEFQGGVILDELIELITKLLALKIDAVEISGHSWGTIPQDGGAFYLSEAQKIYDRTKAKLILTGGLRTPEQMNKILNSSGMEYFGMARPLMKDPNLINKFKAR